MVSASTIRFTSVATDSFTVSWSGPAGYIDHVSGYSVSWSPSEGQPINTGKQTTADLSGLTPGQVYVVTITSQNDVTQASILRKVSVTKQQSASKFIFSDKYFEKQSNPYPAKDFCPENVFFFKCRIHIRASV